MTFRSFLFSTLAFGLGLVDCSGSRHVTPLLGGAVVLDTPKSVSPASVPAPPMAQTAILPASDMSVKPQSAVQGANWTQLPGAASFAAAAPDGSLWVLSTSPAGADKSIWHYANNAWTNISGLASRLSVAPDGTLYAVNSGGGAYHYANGAWTSLGGGCSDITVASDGSIYVLSNGKAAGNDQAIWHYTSGWVQVPGSGVRIAASWDSNSYAQSGGTLSAAGLYVLNSIGSIYHQNTDLSYVQLPGAASAIAPTTIGGIYVLAYPTNANGNSIYYYDLNSAGWTVQSGAGVGISTNSADLYVVGGGGGIYDSPVVAITANPFSEYILPTSNAYPNEIIAGPDGNLWFTENGTNKIAKITPNGALTEYPIPTANSEPIGVALGPDGNLWFTEYGGNKIGKSSPSGSMVEYAIPTSQAYPWDIVAGPDGNLWFTEGSKIGKVSPGGTFAEYLIPTADSGPTGIAKGPDGNLWFVEFYGNKVGKITATGTVTEYPVPTSNSQPIGIVQGPDGNLWFTESNGNKIGKITTGGSIVEYTVPTTQSYPWDIAAGRDGNLWFAEEYSDNIAKITPSGSFTEYLIPTIGSGLSGMATGPDGNLWFTEYYGNKIGKFTAAGPSLITLLPSNSLSFTAAGAAYSQTITASESGYNGTFSSSAQNCTSGGITVATIAAGSNTGQFIVTPAAAGTCSVLISDTTSHNATLNVTVTTTSVGGS